MIATLHCTDISVKFARSNEDARRFRREVDQSDIEIDFMPDKGDSITYFCKWGWVELRVDFRCISVATEDADGIREEFRGKTWYDIYISEMEIMEHYTDDFMGEE